MRTKIMNPETLPRKEREKQRQRREILGAALTLFSDRGFHNVSIQEIAQEAECAIGTIYKFFKTKEDLYRTLVMEQFDAFDEAFTRAINESGDEIDQLRSYVRIKAERFRSNLPVVRLFIAESRGISFTLKTSFAPDIQNRYANFLRQLALTFEKGIQGGRFRQIAPPFELAVALDSTVNAFLLLWLDAPDIHPFPQDPDVILNIFFKGLLNA